MKLINIGFGNMVSADRLVAIVSPDSAPIKRMVQEAREEYKEIENYDYLVVNDKVPDAAAEIMAILLAEDCRIRNRMHLVEGV